MTKDKHGMLDIETLGTNKNAPVVQLAIVTQEADFVMNIPAKEALLYGVADMDTLLWWVQQSNTAISDVFVDTLTVETSELAEYFKPDFKPDIKEVEILEAFLLLGDFIHKHVDYLWSHATFDVPILESFIEAVQKQKEADFAVLPHYRKMRDLRTIEHLYGDEITWEPKDKERAHTAIYDARYQLTHLYNMLDKKES